MISRNIQFYVTYWDGFTHYHTSLLDEDYLSLRKRKSVETKIINFDIDEDTYIKIVKGIKYCRDFDLLQHLHEYYKTNSAKEDWNNWVKNKIEKGIDG